MGAFSFNWEHSLVHEGGFKEASFAFDKERERERERERELPVYTVYRFE